MLLEAVIQLAVSLASERVFPLKRWKIQQAQVFHSSSDRNEIISAGETVLVKLYGGKDDDSLNTLRHVKYVQKLSGATSSLQPNKLPPTSAAAKFHSLRTYFQVQEWLHLGSTETILDPVDWGWEEKGGMLLTVYTDIAVAHDNLLQIITWNCKTDCQTSRCSCRRHGLVCSVACGECRGDSCLNSASKMTILGFSDSDVSDNDM